MKTRLFNRGNGWYVSATNYKDKEDKAYMNVFFPKNSPDFHETEKGYDVLDIFVEEGAFNCYKGKIGLTVFKYSIAESPKQDTKVRIEEEELPFY